MRPELFVKIKNFFKNYDKIIIFFLLFVLLKGIVWSIGIAPFTLSDEVTHFTYVHYLAEHKELPRTESTFTKLEASSVELRKTLRAIEIDKMPLSESHLDFIKTKRDGNDIDPISFHDYLNNPNLRANWSFGYPPAYYIFSSIFYSIGNNLNFDIISIAYFIRFLSVFFLIITLIFSYKIALIIGQDRSFAIVVCSIITLMVSVSAAFSSINNDVALIAFSHIVIYLIFRIFYSSWQTANRLMPFLLTALSAAILSKPQAFVFIPLAAGVYIYNILKNKKSKAYILAGVSLAFFAILTAVYLVLPANFFPAFFQFKSISGSAGLITIIENDILRRFGLVFDFFLQLGPFSFNYPAWIFGILGTLVLMSGLGIILFFYDHLKNKKRNKDGTTILSLSIVTVGMLEILFTFLYYREAILNGVYDFPGQGRYYFIVLAPLIAVFVYGLRHIFELIKLPRRFLYYALILFFAFLNSYSFINVVLQYTYL